VAHVEAGLRSFNWEMPEEINRVLTDRISDFLFTTEKDANKNLEKEGISRDRIFFVGNVMIDTLMKNKEKAEKKSKILARLGLKKREYVVLTLHRAEIVDKSTVLEEILDSIKEVQEKIKVVYPIHPRTVKKVDEFGLKNKLKNMKNLLVTRPLGYLDFLKLMSNSKFVLTDSGGIQEETTILKIPCLTLRKETERPVTVSQGTNIIVGTNKKRIVDEAMKILEKGSKSGGIPELWDGKAAKRIVKILREKIPD
jgi:UDP-N-acetylglucosamine 2-epimerase (non-hydrolysing)